MKATMINASPVICEKVADGDCTILVKKSRPKIDTPFKCYIYCTKGDNLIYLKNSHLKNKYCINNFAYGCNVGYGNGKVIGEFVCDRIDKFSVFENGAVQYWNYHDLEKSCLTYDEISNYIGKNKDGYGWHISDLVIYDEPKELSEFNKAWEGWIDQCGVWHDIRPCQCGKGCKHQIYDYEESCYYCAIDYDGEHCPFIKLTRPPESWCYVEEKENENEKWL